MQLAQKAMDHTGLFFAVDTLEFLHRGGRIGGATRFMGTLLNFKPILAVQDGRVEGIERVRTRGKSLDRIVELAEEQIAWTDTGAPVISPCQRPGRCQVSCLEEASAKLRPYRE